MKEFLKSKTAMYLGGALLLVLVMYLVFRDKADSEAYALMGTDFESDPNKMDADKVLGRNKTSRGNEVAELQRRLKAEGADLGSYGKNKDGVDGVFGKVTEAALMKARGVTEISLNQFSRMLPEAPPTKGPAVVKEFSES